MMERKERRVSVGRTPLFRLMRRWLNAATLSQEQLERAYEQASQRALSRREFLRTAGLLTAAAAAGTLTRLPGEARGRHNPRIAIVGAGMAGLSAAYHLRRRGLRATLYEASERIGGRIYSASDLFAPGLITELGGEFIDSTHQDMLRFVRLFDLELIDLEARSERNLETRYYFNGQSYTEVQIIEALRPIARRIKRDAQQAGYPVTYDNYNAYAYTLDHTSLADYLTQIGATGWLYELLEVAYVTEYGLDAHEQSCLNLIFLIDTQLNDGFDIFGESDERYKVRGGNQQIPAHLAQLMANQIELGHRLVAIRDGVHGYRLTFERLGGGTVEVQADFVLLTLPFTLLREVDLHVSLPPVKRRAIQELGYGTNAKLILGFQSRFWRAQGLNGDFFTDEPFQSGWDSSRLQAGTAGSLTLFLGGTPGVQVGAGTPQAQAAAFLPGVERLFPGATAQYTGNAVRFHWPSYPFAKASYACWKVGQYTAIAGAEFEPVGQLFFAGEHTSIDFQGYMNGAAETGRRAARLILQQVQ
ncbi:MAG: FAD-dependent oxidoreductase [Fimbriimonadales bacterium]|nr:FAD-dependent oxidoreductase [Fimbriimonadales bacterium]